MGTGELLGNPNKLRGVTCDGLASCPGGVEILLAASCHGNQDTLRPDEPVWLQGFSFTTHRILSNWTVLGMMIFAHATFLSFCLLSPVWKYATLGVGMHTYA